MTIDFQTQSVVEHESTFPEKLRLKKGGPLKGSALESATTEIT
jgi:hypothetical protein